MPLTSLACPESAPTYGEAHEFSYCVTQCKNRCLSPFLLSAIASSNEKNHHVGRYISITSITGCNRKLYLERNFDYAQEPQHVLYGYRGTVMHSVLEDAVTWQGLQGKSLEDLGFISEQRLKIGFCFEHGGFKVPQDIDTDDIATFAQYGCPSCDANEVPRNKQEWFVLGGTMDGIEPLWNGGPYKVNDKEIEIPPFSPEHGILHCVIHDLKTKKDYAVQKFIFGDSEATYHTHVSNEHYFQMQGYRYLGELCGPPQVLQDLGVKEIKFVEARIQAFAMGDFPYAGSSYRSRKHYKHAYSMNYIPTIEFQPNEWVENFIRENARNIYDSLIKGETLPKICSPTPKKAHSFLCNFCSFHATEWCPNPGKEWQLMEEGVGDAYKQVGGSITMENE